MGLILGLDVSTSTVGLCLLRSDVVPQPNGSHIELLDRIEFKKCRTVWDKADVVRERLASLGNQSAIDRICIEEALMGFRPGMSSAQTISTLMRFNGIVSYIAREEFGIEPEYIGSAHARKVCGIKLQRTGVAGPQKEQCFAHMKAHDLAHVAWPQTKSGKDVPWSRDATDAYVIARAGLVIGHIAPPPKKPRQTKGAAP